jgi:hypothetical protein
LEEKREEKEDKDLTINHHPLFPFPIFHPNDDNNEWNGTRFGILSLS